MFAPFAVLFITEERRESKREGGGGGRGRGDMRPL